MFLFLVLSRSKWLSSCSLQVILAWGVASLPGFQEDPSRTFGSQNRAAVSGAAVVPVCAALQRGWLFLNWLWGFSSPKLLNLNQLCLRSWGASTPLLASPSHRAAEEQCKSASSCLVGWDRPQESSLRSAQAKISRTVLEGFVFLQSCSCLLQITSTGAQFLQLSKPTRSTQPWIWGEDNEFLCTN